MTTLTDTFRKEIKFDRQSKDFACYLDGEFVGYAASYSAGEALLDQIAYDLLADGAALSAAQFAGGSEPDTCAAEVAAAVLVACPDCGEIYCTCDPPAPEPQPSPRPPHGPQPFPFTVSALLAEADQVMAEVHYAAVNLSDRERCPFCCGPHAAERCPLKRRTHQLDLVVRPRHCGNCGGEHSIQACPELLAALFAPEVRTSKRWPKTASVAAAVMLWFVVVACAGDATCSPRNDGSRVAAACVTQ